MGKDEDLEIGGLTGRSKTRWLQMVFVTFPQINRPDNEIQGTWVSDVLGFGGRECNRSLLLRAPGNSTASHCQVRWRPSRHHKRY